MEISDCAGLVARRDGRLVVRAMVLSLIAQGRLPVDGYELDGFETFLDALCAGIVEGTPNAILGIRPDELIVDFRPLDDAPPGRSAADVPPEWRNAALKAAGRLWDHAIATTVAAGIPEPERESWASEAHDVWLSWRPRDRVLPDQGWKLHVAATPLTAPLVLQRCSRVLLAARTAFKHARSVRDIRMLTSRAVERSQGGKFLTVYPADAGEARAMAQRLHEATSDMRGPRILSDKPYREASLVHYRFGSFVRRRTLTNVGTYDDRLTDPEGRRVEDARKAWYSPPKWVEPLFPEPAATQRPPKEGASSRVVAGRYEIVSAIRHLFRGSVYRALDRVSGEAVILKQARPNTASGLSEGDSVDSLLREAEMLKRLAGLGPAFIDLFERQGHHFLVQSAIDGETLRSYAERAAEAIGPPEHDPRALFGRVCRLLRDVHARGLVCRDFTPANIMLERGGALKLIDPELAIAPNTCAGKIYTPGYAAPEQVNGPHFSVDVGQAADLYALGATLYLLATGARPPLYFEGEPAAALEARWKAASRAIVEGLGPQLADLALRLTQFDPSARPSLERVIGFVERAIPLAVGPSVARRADAAQPSLDRIVASGRTLLLDSLMSADPQRNSSSYGLRTDVCNVQHGLGGHLDYLCRTPPTLEEPRVDQAIRTVAARVERELAEREQLLPGLYFGAAGPIWALLGAARRVGDPAMATRAMALLDRLPSQWPSPELYQGLAGAGLARCHAWSMDPRPELLEAIDASADSLARQASHSGRDVYWRIPDDFDAQMGGGAQYGFAHGVAGVGYFLLMAGQVTGRERHLDLAVAAGDTLLRAAEPCRCGIRWRANLDASASKDPGLRYYQCNGSAGVGSFLVRLWKRTGEPRFKAAAEGAAAAAHAVRWRPNTIVCCGSAGCGQFLLDMAEFVDARYAEMAADVAEALLVRTSEREDGFYVTDEPDGRPVIDYNSGLTGVVDFLERLKRRGPRPWMVDSLL